MSLNRLSLFTNERGQNIRVRDMSFAELFSAREYIERLEIDLICEDPYSLQAMCSGMDYCPDPKQPLDTINGYSLEDWRLFLDDRMEHLTRVQDRLKQYPKKQPFSFKVLVKYIKFW